MIRELAKSAINRLPYSARRIVLHAVTHGIRQPTPFVGVYSSFADVTDVRRPKPEQRVMFAKSGLSLKRDAFTDRPVLRNNHQLLPLVAAMLGTSPLRVLDFGGSGGIDFQNLTAAAPELAIERYLIVETPDTVAAGRALWPDEQRIAFASELPAAGERFDLVYAWGALHCADDPIGLLRRLAGYGPRAMLFTWSPFAERAFVRGQGRPSQKTREPRWVLGLPAVEQAMHAAGYRLAVASAAGEHENVDNFAPEYRVSDSHTLLFLPRA